MEETPQDAPVAPPQEPTVQTPDEPTNQTVTAPAEPTTPVETPVEAPVDTPAPVEEEDDPIQYESTHVPQLDFSQLPVDENNLIDPNVLAQSINQQMAATVQSAAAAARNEVLEQRTEEKLWDKAYDSHPELKTNKDLRNLVHQARIGEATDLLARTKDPQSVKLPTPAQIADKLFKQIGQAKTDGMKQATENVKVQSSAYVETGGTKTNDASDQRQQLIQNFNNPKREVAIKARNDYLKSMLFPSE